MHEQTSAPNTIEYSKPIQDRHTSPSHQKSSLARTKFGKMANRGQPEMVKCWKTLNRLGKRQPVNTSDPLDYYTCMRTPPAQKVTRVAQTKIHSARVSRITNLDYSSVCLCRARELVDVLEQRFEECFNIKII